MWKLKEFLGFKQPFLDGLYRSIYEGKRTRTWQRASKRYKKRNPYCAACPRKNKKIECHDILPYHCLTNKQKNNYRWLIQENFISLCRSCHHYFGHCKDPQWRDYNPEVIIYAKSLSDEIRGEKTRCK